MNGNPDGTTAEYAFNAAQHAHQEAHSAKLAEADNLTRIDKLEARIKFLERHLGVHAPEAVFYGETTPETVDREANGLIPPGSDWS